MADQQIGNLAGVTAAFIGDADSKTNLSGTADPQGGWEDDDLDTIASMRSRLNTLNATLYSAVNLNKMTFNDMVYAIRLADSPTTIK